MTRAELINAVQVKMEELTPLESTLSVLSDNSEVHPLTSYIDNTLDEASDSVRLVLPLHRLTPKQIAQTKITGTPPTTVSTITDVNGVVSVELPDDFLRLYAVKFDVWSREVNRPISTENPAYDLQRNAHTRGGLDKPVVALTYANGKRYLECYSVTDGEEYEAEKLLYVARIPAEQNTDEVLVFVVYQCAIKVYEIFGNVEMVKLLTEELVQMIKTELL